MPGVFICYRREDSIAYAGRIYDRLSSEFGVQRVFMDLDGIDPGDDFIEVIRRQVSGCDALVAVIGKSWLAVQNEQGGRRLDHPDDYVRLEIETALNRNVRVIPALVGGARMPAASNLPHELRGLARRNAIEISDVAFHVSLDRMVAVLKRGLDNSRTTEVEPGGSTTIASELGNDTIAQNRSAEVPLQAPLQSRDMNQERQVVTATKPALPERLTTPPVLRPDARRHQILEDARPNPGEEASLSEAKAPDAHRRDEEERRTREEAHLLDAQTAEARQPDGLERRERDKLRSEKPEEETAEPMTNQIADVHSLFGTPLLTEGDKRSQQNSATILDETASETPSSGIKIVSIFAALVALILLLLSLLNT